MERHAQTIISLVIASILLWAGSSLSELREIVARQDERLVTLQRTVDGFGVVRNDLSSLRDSVTTNESTLKFLEAQFQQRE